MRAALDEFAPGGKWRLNEGDGAFYGPKIDIHVKDALRRSHQCATIQLDFQLPIRFELEYKGADGEHHRPVMIHRAILGSLERCIGVLTESFGGKWPLWLSPRQVQVVPVSSAFDDYAYEVRRQLLAAGLLRVDVDGDASATLNKKIRNAQLAQYNYILVVGERESKTASVNVRTRDGHVHGEVTVAALGERLVELQKRRALDDGDVVVFGETKENVAAPEAEAGSG